MVVNKAEKITKERKGKRSLIPEKAPKQLVARGILNQEDWGRLEEKTKLYILEAHIGENWVEELGLKEELEKMEGDEDIPPGVYRNKKEERGKKPETVINVKELQEEQKLRDDFEEIKQEIEQEKARDLSEKESVDKSTEAKGKPPEEAKLSKEEKKRIRTEQGGNQNKGKLQFFGYQPTSQLVKACNKVSAEGDVEDASTWIATLIKKMLASKH